VTYLDGIHAGLWLLGILTPLLAVAALVLAAHALDVPHRVRVAKLRRNDRRAGRTVRVAPGHAIVNGVEYRINGTNLEPTDN